MALETSQLRAHSYSWPSCYSWRTEWVITLPCTLKPGTVEQGLVSGDPGSLPGNPRGHKVLVPPVHLHRNSDIQVSHCACPVSLWGPGPCLALISQGTDTVLGRKVTTKVKRRPEWSKIADFSALGNSGEKRVIPVKSLGNLVSLNIWSMKEINITHLYPY